MPNKTALFWLKCGALLAGLSVVFGAFAAHLLGDFLLQKYSGISKEVLGQSIPAASKYLADFKTAAEYQMSHALGLIAVGLLAWQSPRRSLNVAGWSFLIGTILFSGSLYLLVLTGITKLGAITPIGGTLFLIGWGAMFYAVTSAAGEVKN
jgi:uncharacterized membrane protein YgdD (TMEM256/DUF423 family)